MTRNLATSKEHWDQMHAAQLRDIENQKRWRETHKIPPVKRPPWTYADLIGL